MIKIIEKYHINLDRGNELLIHDKLRRNSNIGLELSAGIINFKRFLNLNDKNYFNSGMILHFNLPRINERLYLRTGIFVANLNFEEEDVTLYRIPIHLEYIHSKGFIKPRLSYGLNINLPYIDNAVSVNAGVSIGINKRLDIILASETDFRAFALFFPKNYLAQSVQLGLNFNFDN